MVRSLLQGNLLTAVDDSTILSKAARSLRRVVAGSEKHQDLYPCRVLLQVPVVKMLHLASCSGTLHQYQFLL